MRRRSPLIGFTEAELGFIIAAVVAATATMTSAESPLPDPEGPDSVAVVSTDTGSAKGVDTVTMKVVDTAIAKPGKRDELPYCSQFGLEESPLPPIAILDSARYRVNGRTVRVTQLKAMLATAVSQSTARQCKYKLFFRVVGDLPHRVVRKAKAPFFARFYISDVE